MGAGGEGLFVAGILAGLHAVLLLEEGAEVLDVGKARVGGGVGHAEALAQQFGGTVQADEADELLGAVAGE